mmetsp:Transcript_10964/g.31453  ORF Transcript_10964/g.31453 Transcript_10964/m.31453 type:complete len:312 (+) Transcript_10964:180-1115(+)
MPSILNYRHDNRCTAAAIVRKDRASTSPSTASASSAATSKPLAPISGSKAATHKRWRYVHVEREHEHCNQQQPDKAANQESRFCFFPFPLLPRQENRSSFVAVPPVVTKTWTRSVATATTTMSSSSLSSLSSMWTTSRSTTFESAEAGTADDNNSDTGSSIEDRNMVICPVDRMIEQHPSLLASATAYPPCSSSSQQYRRSNITNSHSHTPPRPASTNGSSMHIDGIMHRISAVQNIMMVTTATCTTRTTREIVTSTDRTPQHRNRKRFHHHEAPSNLPTTQSTDDKDDGDNDNVAAVGDDDWGYFVDCDA